MQYQHLTLEISNIIPWVKFNRPAQLHSVNAVIMDNFVHALDFINKADSREQKGY